MDLAREPASETSHAAPFFARRTVLVDAHARGVDHHDLAVKAGRNRLQQPVPYSGFAPAHEPVVAGRRRAIALGYLGLRRAGAEPPEDAVQHPPVIDTRHAARLVRQQRLDNRPLRFRQFVPPPRHQASIPMESLNQPKLKPQACYECLRPNPLTNKSVHSVGADQVAPAAAPPVWLSSVAHYAAT